MSKYIMIYLLVALLLIAGIIYYLVNHTKSSSKIQTVNLQKTKVHRPQKNAFNDLRSMAFSVTPEQLHINLPNEETTVFGVIMDWGMQEATATIVAFQTGDASCYLSSGGGMIGGSTHENISMAAKQFVSTAQSYIPSAVKTDLNELPKEDEVFFYLLTNKGVYVGKEIMKNFENNSSAWIELFGSANNLLDELRKQTEGSNN